MADNNYLQQLRDFDLSDLSSGDIGRWPAVVKFVILLLAFLACIAAGYFFMIKDKQAKLDVAEAKEQQLKKTFNEKSFEAANLEAYRLQMAEMEESFEALLSQLPTDTEVPGLLEDITNRGIENGLEIKAIKLQPEVTTEFYVELPISIEVLGSYHNLAAFVSGIAALPRIVTLHDFEITQEGSLLLMKITAKTYRYKSEEDA